MAVPIVLMGVILASVMVGSMVQRSMQANRQLDRTYNKKSAFYVAEAGMNHAVKELMKAPFFSRFILKDFIEAARSGMGRPAGQVGQIPAEWGDKVYGPIVRDGVSQIGGLGWAELTGNYGDGKFTVTLVEHVSQSFMAKAGAPGAGNSIDPVKATLDHIAVYARGLYPDPSTGDTTALLTAKILFRPEPFIFEYDTNGDGISNPVKMDKQTEPGTPPPAATADDGTRTDLAFHPFLSPGRYAVWNQGNFQSSPPANVSLIKYGVHYQTVRAGDVVRKIADFDFKGNAVTMPADPLPADYFAKNATINPDRKFMQDLLKSQNKKFVLNYGSNKLVKDTFAKGDLPKDLIPKDSLDIPQADLEQIVDTAAGGKLQNLDPAEDLGKIIKAWIERYTEDLPTHSGKTAYGTDPGQAELQLMEDTSLGKRTQYADNLGKVFGIPQAELDKLNELIDAFGKGQIKNGKDLLALKGASSGGSPVDYVDDLTGAQEFYAPVLFPRGKPDTYQDQVPDGNAIPDYNGNKVADPEEIDQYLAANPQLNGKPPMTTIDRYRIGNEFMSALKGGAVADPAGLYADMQAAKDEINAPPVSDSFTADLSARPPSFAQMEHTIILKAQSDPRLDIRLKDALKEALKWVEVPGAENGETGEVAPVALAVGLSYSMKWECFCKDQAETEDDKSRESKRSASAGGVAR